MNLSEIKVGDMVVVKYINPKTGDGIPKDVAGNAYPVHKIDGKYIGLKVPGAKGVDGCWWFFSNELERSPDAHMWLLAEKVVCNGVRCRKITGFGNIPHVDAVPHNYLEYPPAACRLPPAVCKIRNNYRCGRYIVDLCGCMVWSNDGNGGGPEGSIALKVLPNVEPVIDAGHSFLSIPANSIFTETTFQAILTWIGRADRHLTSVKNGDELSSWRGTDIVVPK